MSDWFVVTTKPRKEVQAAFNLANQGFDVFLPRMRRTVRHARRFHIAVIPLFPAYLFLEASSAVRWRSINGTFGVKRIITGDDGPVTVERGFVEALKSRANDNGVVDFSSELKPGDSVEILDGPLAQQIGQLVDLDERGRVTVLMEFLASRVPVQMTVDRLMRA
ncbi:transcription termination/antitermination NusG family protein [Aquamicrobium terrae]|uniref:Transcriptional antiterminator RfaH n=1 Tax=Aquamicrobium terrae TaxID=1324945 RepID=A0ABV2N226_9HYPH